MYKQGKGYLIDSVSLMSIVRKDKNPGGRSLEVTRTYLQRGQGISQSIWIKVSPKNALAKAILALPAGAFMLLVFILILLALGFTLMAITLMSAFSKREGNNKGGDEDVVWKT